MRLIRTRTNAFTLIELIVVTTVTVVVAVTAVPMFVRRDGQKLARAAHELVTHIKYARTLAMATRRHTWVTFDTKKETYEVYIQGHQKHGHGKRVKVPHPVTGDNKFKVFLNQDEFTGVEIASASFGGGDEVGFDWLGTPYDGKGALLTEDGTVVLSASGNSATVRVTADTGLVEQE